MGTRTDFLINGSDSEDCDSVTGPRAQWRASQGGSGAEGPGLSPDAFQREFEMTLKSGDHAAHSEGAPPPLLSSKRWGNEREAAANRIQLN